MYYEMRHEDVVWNEWNNKRTTVDGDWCWRAEGVTLYNPTREEIRRTIVPHRFAINPRGETTRSKLRTDRYYMHIYQTKIGPDRLTLRSIEMARELNQMFGNIYWPRKFDEKTMRTRRTETTKSP